MPSRPLIGVTARPLPAGRVRGWSAAGTGVMRPYLDALHRAGADEAIMMPVPLDREAALARLRRLDGLLVTGGGDVDPGLYGQPARAETYGVDRDSDGFEIALVRAAAEEGVSTLAICRGIQVMNVAFGGSLDQHITDREGLVGHGVPGAEPAAHVVRVATGTALHAAVGIDELTCSSHHHQAIDVLGDGLVATGWSVDGIVEAVEVRSAAWMIGVQWHPEDTAGRDPAQQLLFDALVSRSRKPAS